MPCPHFAVLQPERHNIVSERDITEASNKLEQYLAQGEVGVVPQETETLEALPLKSALPQ